MTVPDPRLDALLEAGTGPRLEALLRWLLEASPAPAEDGEPRRTSRLRRLQAALAGRNLEAPLREAWTHASAVRLLAETGLPDRTTLLGEGLQRVVDRIIPRLDPEGDLYALLDGLGLDEADARWLEALPGEVLAPWADLLALPPETWFHAARLLAHRAAAVGLARDLLALDPEGSDAESPFFELDHIVRSLAEAPGDPAARNAWEEGLAACRATLDRAHARLDERGVSTDLIFRMELAEAQLARMDRLLGFALGRGDGRAFAAELVQSCARQHDLGALLRTTVKRLSRKVVEHTGETGEHYIARNRAEWWAMGRSAAGGGLLTAGTALVKFGLFALPLAPLVLGLGVSGNYAFSFIAMQLLGFSLASKQPAMTAAALARALEEDNGREAEIEAVAAITRTQVMATLGNVLVTIPTAVGLCLLWRWATGHAPLGPETALHGLEMNDPRHLGTWTFAAITGVILWLSSLAAGWTANWSAYRGLPEALAQNHRLKAWFGPAATAALARFVRRQLPGMAGYAALGLLLGFVPLVAAFAGIHLEVRHVTLQAASLGLAAASLFLQQGALPWGELAWGLLGIGLIGVLNFTVSFALALWTAIRARDLDGRASRRLWIEILRTFNRQPGRFLGAPPKA